MSTRLSVYSNSEMVLLCCIINMNYIAFCKEVALKFGTWTNTEMYNVWPFNHSPRE